LVSKRIVDPQSSLVIPHAALSALGAVVCVREIAKWRTGKML